MQSRAAIYCRISEHDAVVPKVEIQEERCRAAADMAGYLVSPGAAYVDDGISGFLDRDRPGWERLKADIAAGRYDVVMATEQTRFSRKSDQTIQFQVLCSVAGVGWHTLGEGISDPSTADGAFQSTVRSAFAQMESHRKSERQRNASRARAAAGKPHPGARKFGYEDKRLELRPAEADELRWAYDTILNGGSIYSIIRRWNLEGILTATGKRWSYAQVQQLLRRKSNAGIVVHAGKVLEGVEATWEPVVSREVFDTANAILTDPSRSVSQNREPRWLCAGLALCGVCGSTMRSAGANSRGKAYTVYRCSAKMSIVSDGARHAAHDAANLDALVRNAVVSTFLFGPTRLSEDLDSDEREVSRQLVKRAEIQQRRDNLADLVELEGMTAHNRKRLAELREEQDRIEAEIRRIELASARAQMRVASRAALFGSPGKVDIGDAVTTTRQLGERFDSLSIVDRRTLVRDLLTITINPGRAADRVHIEHHGAPSLDGVDEVGDVSEWPTPGAPGAAPDDLGA